MIRDLRFPFGRHDGVLPAGSTGADAVLDNVRRILLTPRGSRVMRPEVGSDVAALVFGNRGQLLSARLDHEVRRAIAANEPRARVLAVNIEEIEDSVTGEPVIQVTVDIEVLGETRRVEERI